MAGIGVQIVVTAIEQDLSACISSVADYVDEIVVADMTGASVIAEIAAAHGARRVAAADCATVPEARTRALKGMTTDWVLALDGDEMLEPHDAEVLGTHLCDDSVAIYSIPVRHYVNSLRERTLGMGARPNPICVSEKLDSYPAYLSSYEPRLFQRNSIRCFQETAGRSVEVREAAKGIKCRASFGIHKTPVKSDRDVQMRRTSGERRKQIEPSAVASLGLGILEYEARDYATALGHLRDACIVDANGGVAWLYLAMCLVKLGDYQRAIEATVRAEMNGLHLPMVAETMGEALYLQRDFAGARSSFLRALRRAEKLQPHCVGLIVRKLQMAEWQLSGTPIPFHQAEFEDALTTLTSKSSAGELQKQKQSLSDMEQALLLI